MNPSIFWGSFSKPITIFFPLLFPGPLMSASQHHVHIKIPFSREGWSSEILLLFMVFRLFILYFIFVITKKWIFSSFCLTSGGLFYYLFQPFLYKKSLGLGGLLLSFFFFFFFPGVFFLKDYSVYIIRYPRHLAPTYTVVFDTNTGDI